MDANLKLIARRAARRHCYGLLAAMTTVFLLTTATPTLADDVEIFVSTDDQALACQAPNVLFVIDTSGSMDATVTTQEPWDKTQSYSGCFDSNRVYYSSTGTAPECGTSTSFTRSQNACQTASGVEYTGLLQTFDAGTQAWRRLVDETDTGPVECAADEGLHGDGSGPETYAADGSAGPWSENAADRISWGTNATAATLFDGNWLNWQLSPPTVDLRRIDVVKEVVNNALDGMVSVNAGLMEFNQSQGGPVSAAIEDLATSREALQARITSLVPDGGTPLAETLYEAGQYMAGRNIQYGDEDSANRSVAASRTGNTLSSGQYQSPIGFASQNNYIVLLTDGEPSSDTDAAGRIEGLPNFSTLVGDSCDPAVDGSCLDGMAAYLFAADLRADLPGKQNVITHTIGFTVDLPLLETTAARGGGKYFIADNTVTLTRALSNLAKDFSRRASLLARPSIPIDPFNTANRLQDVYLSVFEPTSTYQWPGNLKKYRTQQNTSGDTELRGANGAVALNSGDDFISPDAVSFWSAPLVDGNDVRLGGAASRLINPNTRKLLTNASGTTLSQLQINNSAITAALIGAPAAERDTVINWARGFDARDANGNGSIVDPRLGMGDPLHVQPVIGAYGADTANADAVVFVATNDGYVHAFDARFGNEIWSFIPRRLLSRLYSLSLDEAAPNKQYGLDGQLVLLTDAAGRPETLIFGMRRGGDALFALDISNRTNPSVKWIVDSATSGFADLGQTWSKPTIAKVKVGGTVRDVAIIGGGYDPGQDNRTFRTDTKGNALYMIDVANGDLLWSAGSASTALGNPDLQLSDMDFSIPAQIGVIDLNGNGLADKMFVGDMGGQVWRFDIVNGNPAGTLVEGGVLASLGGAAASGSPAAQDVRRFYNRPGIVNVVSGDNVFLAINIGSGYRAHPLDAAIDDEFFSIRDFRSREVVPSSDYSTAAMPLVTRAALRDVTNDANPVIPPDGAGWRYRMVQGVGEKILGESLTVDNVLFFNSFTPLDASITCLPGGGLNRNYRVGLIAASAITNLDRSADPNNLTPEDRFVEGRLGAPVAGPQLGPGNKPCSGLDCFDPNDPFDTGDTVNDSTPGNKDDYTSVRPTYWYPAATQ